ncbi:MAG: hypothetical protein QM655_16480 [Nocardioidaceae bacterium]
MGKLALDTPDFRRATRREFDARLGEFVRRHEASRLDPKEFVDALFATVTWLTGAPGGSRAASRMVARPMPVAST